MAQRKKEIKISEYGDWCYCPNQPGVMRRLVGFDDEGMPIIEEKEAAEIELEKQDNLIDKSCAGDENMK